MTTERVVIELPSDLKEIAEQMAADQGVSLKDWLARGVELLLWANAAVDVAAIERKRRRTEKLSPAQLRRERLRDAKREFLRSNPSTRQ